jgi:hypothetical protein
MKFRITTAKRSGNHPSLHQKFGGGEDFFTYFLKVGRDALLRCEGLPTGISFSFSIEFFNSREERFTNILYKTVFAFATLEILSALRLSQENSLKYDNTIARC